MIPRIGDIPEPGRRYRLRPGAYAVLPRDGMVLITQQSEPIPECQLPGGGIDPGESPVQALHREVYEETGYRIAHPRRLGAFRRYTYMPEYDLWAEKMCHVYVALPTFRVSMPVEPDHEVHWVPPEVVLAVLANDGDRMLAARILK